MSNAAEVIRSVNIYIGIPMFVCGVTGNLLNIRLFWRTRHNPCAFIFLALSAVNCVALLCGLFTRIIGFGFGLDWSSASLIWCKMRSGFSTASFLASTTCVCLASIDRLLASCRQEKYRRWSRLWVAQCSVLVTVIVWMGHSVPDLIYRQLVQNPVTSATTCLLINPQTFDTYRSYVSIPLYIGVIPTIILTVTGTLTYRNMNVLQRVRQREAIQRQLTRMILIQIPIILVPTMPYVIFTEYQIFSANVPKENFQRMAENIISNVLTLIFYTTFASSFFVFFFSSRSFQNDTRKLLCCQRMDSSVRGIAQVQPLTMVAIGKTQA